MPLTVRGNRLEEAIESDAGSSDCDALHFDSIRRKNSLEACIASFLFRTSFLTPSWVIMIILSFVKLNVWVYSVSYRRELEPRCTDHTVPVSMPQPFEDSLRLLTL